MFGRKLSCVLIAALAAGAALAHHNPIPLSHAMGGKILDSAIYFRQLGNVGIPAYLPSSEEVEHHAPMQLAPGDFLTVRGAGGVADVVQLEEGDFRNFNDVELEEFLSLINTKTDLAEVSHENGYVVFRGPKGGPAAHVELEDGTGAPLAQLGYGLDARQAGALDLAMEISVPDEGHGFVFAGHPYVVLASRTAGTSEYLGVEIPIGQDVLTDRFQQLVAAGRLPTFMGRLDEGQDGRAVVPARILEAVLKGGAPSEIHFVFVVLSPDLGTVEFVSNRFTLDIVE
jgi:hypothetical protein